MTSPCEASVVSNVSPTEPTLFRPEVIRARLGPGPWRQPLFHDGRNDVALVCDAPASQTGDAPLSRDCNEFCFVLRGEYEYRIEGVPPVRAVKGDIVMCPAGLAHTARVVGERHGLRVEVSPSQDIVQLDGHQKREDSLIGNEPPNMVLTRTSELLAGSDQRRFTIIEDDLNTMYLIRERPGDVSNAHWHFDFDEWWVIGGGELLFEVGEGRPKLHAKAGDIVFTPRGFRHQIATVGGEVSLRMPVTTADNVHIWTDDDTSAPPPRK